MESKVKALEAKLASQGEESDNETASTTSGDNETQEKDDEMAYEMEGSPAEERNEEDDGMEMEINNGRGYEMDETSNIRSNDNKDIDKSNKE